MSIKIEGRNYHPCAHKNLTHHSVRVGDQRIWQCSYCGSQDRWSDGWTYFGNMECKKCETAQVDEVRCPTCAGKERKDG